MDVDEHNDDDKDDEITRYVSKMVEEVEDVDDGTCADEVKQVLVSL